MRKPIEPGGFTPKLLGGLTRSAFTENGSAVYRKWECSLPKLGVSLVITYLNIANDWYPSAL